MYNYVYIIMHNIMLVYISNVCNLPYLTNISSKKKYSISEMSPKANLNTEVFFDIDFWKHHTTNAIEIGSKDCLQIQHIII